jgi:hypothetical protein
LLSPSRTCCLNVAWVFLQAKKRAIVPIRVEANAVTMPATRVGVGCSKSAQFATVSDAIHPAPRTSAMQTRRNRVRSASQARSPDLAGSSAQDAAVDSAMRTPEQTERALFFSDNAVAQYQASMRGIAAERDLEVIAEGSVS